MWRGDRFSDKIVPPWALDLLLALFLTAFVVLGSAVFPTEASQRPLDMMGIFLLTIAALSIVVRRLLPITVAIVTIGCALSYFAGSYPGIFADTPAVIAGYTLVSTGRRRSAGLAGVVLCAGILTIGFLPGRDPAGATTGALWVLGFWVAFMVAGQLAFRREEYLRVVAERSAQTERASEELALRRAGEERLRIARDLHDSLTHTISVITVQAGVAQHLAAQDPKLARDSLAVISEAGRDAMDQLRATLGTLYESNGPVGDESAPTQPTLDEIPTLLERTRAGGTPVDWQSAVTVDLSAPVQATVYRILQESLANVARHAPGATARVRLRMETHELVLTVVNAVPSAAPEPTGGNRRGVANMRQRAHLSGGTLRARTGPDGEHHVEARFPLPR